MEIKICEIDIVNNEMIYRDALSIAGIDIPIYHRVVKLKLDPPLNVYRSGKRDVVPMPEMLRLLSIVERLRTEPGPVIKKRKSNLTFQLRMRL